MMIKYYKDIKCNCGNLIYPCFHELYFNMINGEIFDMNDNFQVDYEPNKRELYINLPKKVWDKIDNIIFTRHFNMIEEILSKGDVSYGC